MASRVARVAVAVLAVLAAAGLAGCGGGHVTAHPREGEAALPGYCSPDPSSPPDEAVTDREFWRLVHRSCRVATDGDRGQGKALQRALEPLDAQQVARFQRRMVQANRSLYTRAVVDAADQACLPHLGLGTDLGTDFRSWIIAHGQAAYDGVLRDPRLLTRFPDLEDGCGMGEPFGYAGVDVYDRKTGLRPDTDRLPILEPITPPRR